MAVTARVRRLLVVVVATLGTVAVAAPAAATPDASAAAAGARLGFSPAAVSFTVAAGETSPPQPIAVLNGRSEPVHIAGLVSSDPHFRLGAGCGPQAIPAGGRCTTTLAYAGDASTTSATTTLTGAGGLTLTAVASVVPPLAAVPSVRFPETLVGATAPGVRTITVRNNSAASLTLASVVDMPATALTFDLTGCLGRTLPPGGTCPVTVRFQPGSGLPDAARVTLPTADGVWSTVLEATGVSRPRLAADEAELSWLDVQVGVTARRVLHLHPTAPGPVTVTGVSVPTGYTLAADGCSGTTLRDTATCSIAIDLTPTAASTSTLGAVHVTSTGGDLDVATENQPRRPFLVTPTALSFGAEIVGSTSPVQDVTVTNVTTRPQHMAFAHPAFPGFLVTDGCTGTTLAPAASCRVGIAFAPSTPTGYFQSHTVRVDGVDAGLSLYGAGQTQPPASWLQVTPTSLDFGDVDTAEPAPPQSVTVTNQGTAPVTLTGRVVHDRELQVIDPCAGTTLAPGASCTSTVRPRPAAAGETKNSGVVFFGGYVVQTSFHSVEHLAMQGGTDLGPVDLGGTVSGTLRFVDVGPVPITLSDPPPIRSAWAAFPVAVTADGCTGVTLQPGDSCPVTVSATPGSTADERVGVAGVWDGQIVAGLADLQPRSWFAVDAAGLALGATGRRTPQPGRFTVTNVGTTTRTLPRCAVTGAFIVTGCGSTSLAPGATRVVSVTVAAQVDRHEPGVMSWLDAASGSYVTVALSGDDIWDLAVPSTLVQLGPQATGSAVTQDLWVLDDTDHDVVVQAAAHDLGGTGTITFVDQCDGVTLHPGGACSIGITFTPTEVGRVRRPVYLSLGVGAGYEADVTVPLLLWST